MGLGALTTKPLTTLANATASTKRSWTLSLEDQQLATSHLPEVAVHSDITRPFYLPQMPQITERGTPTLPASPRVGRGQAGWPPPAFCSDP